jgi:hypothetical protein
VHGAFLHCCAMLQAVVTHNQSAQAVLQLTAQLVEPIGR